MTEYPDDVEFTEFGVSATSVHKTWIGTLNNYTPLELRFFQNLDCTRSAIGEEIAPSGTPHLQFFLAFSKGYRLSGLKKLNGRAHWLRCKSPQHAWNYCIKDGLFEVQDNRHQGSRSDIHRYRDRIKEGATDRELCDEHPCEFLKFSRTDAMRSAYAQERYEMTRALLLYGPTGVGKSTWVKQLVHRSNADWLQYDGKFFSQYRNKPVAIFDDVDLNKFNPKLLLRLINHTPMKVSVKGGWAEWNPELVIFICNHLPWYISDGQDALALQRRIVVREQTMIGQFSTNYLDLMRSLMPEMPLAPA